MVLSKLVMDNVARLVQLRRNLRYYTKGQKLGQTNDKLDYILNISVYPDILAERICAFLNTKDGGNLLIGVKDDGTVEGIQFRDSKQLDDFLRLDVDDKTLRAINPQVFPTSYCLNVVKVYEGDSHNDLYVVEISIAQELHDQLYETRAEAVYVRNQGKLHGARAKFELNCEMRGTGVRHNLDKLSFESSQIRASQKAVEEVPVTPDEIGRFDENEQFVSQKTTEIGAELSKKTDSFSEQFIAMSDTAEKYKIALDKLTKKAGTIEDMQKKTIKERETSVANVEKSCKERLNEISKQLKNSEDYEKNQNDEILDKIGNNNKAIVDTTQQTTQLSQTTKQLEDDLEKLEKTISGTEHLMGSNEDDIKRNTVIFKQDAHSLLGQLDQLFKNQSEIDEEHAKNLAEFDTTINDILNGTEELLGTTKAVGVGVKQIQEKGNEIWTQALCDNIEKTSADTKDLERKVGEYDERITHGEQARADSKSEFANFVQRISQELQDDLTELEQAREKLSTDIAKRLQATSRRISLLKTEFRRRQQST